MKKRSGTDGSLLASLPWTLAALSFSLLPHVPFLPVWITLAFVVCAGGRWLVELRRWRLPPAWMRIALSLACFIGVLASYEAVSGVGPGSALLAIMAALKLMETRQRRDQFVLLFISIFLTMASLLREQYLWSMGYLFVSVLITMTAWLQMAARDGSGIGASLRTSSRLLLYSAPLMLAMWVFFPRIATPFWAVPIDTSAASSGLSDSMSPGDISSLSLSDAVAFRVQFAGAVPAPRDRYWRGLVLYRFDSRSWSGLDATPDWQARDRVEYLGEPVSYSVTMEPTGQQWVFALDMPYDVSLRRTFFGPQHQLARPQPIDQRIVYEATSYSRYRVDRDTSRTPLNWYLRLPTVGNPQTLQLARELRQSATSEQDYIDLVLQRFHEQEYFYTLQPPVLGSNPVDEFLFRTRRGFCEHYASAFAVLMRAAGIPSRIVLGYQGGELNPMGNYLIVRQSDAHAWTEVWLPERGWVRVDPTAAVAPERIESGMFGALVDGSGASWGLGDHSQWLHRITLTWDAINTQWNEWVLAYGPDKQSSLMEWLGMENPDWRKMMLTLIGLVMVLILGISLLLFRRNRPPPADVPARLYRRFVQKAGLPPLRGETPFEYASRLKEMQASNATAIDDITERYLRVRYAANGEPQLQTLKLAVDNYRPVR
jgi:protein-glutamine gamma-glutamyltransferase